MTRKFALGLLSAALALVASGCSSQQEHVGPSTTYEDATAKTTAPKCPTGYVLQCETKKTGRIRFSSIGGGNLETCSCEEYRGMPTQSPLPGVY
ncbi:MAG: hypothetical protein OEW35_18225 [Gammaproteobacteria bacterium]|nr:hypothetical protein [Gammaproteobacteria bacterium]MDH5312025.1 hypothetical protein [Gammaproteobacteria bacterium]